MTLNPEYAKLHASEGYSDFGREYGDVIKMKVKVKEVFSDGNDLNEFGYYPVDRLQRAKDLGFDTDKVYYHGTSDADIKDFKVPSRDTGQTKTVGTGIFFSSSPDVANTYVKKAEKGVIYPVFVKKDKFLTIRPNETSLFSTIEPESTFVFNSKGENIGSLVDFGFYSW